MFEELKQLIIEYIKQNGTESITGNILQGVLLEMVDELGSWAEGSEPPFANLDYVNQKLAEEATARANGDNQLSEKISAEVTARQQAISALSQQVTQMLTNYYKKTETMSTVEINALVTQTIANYYTKAETNSAIAQAVNTLTQTFYNKTETNALLDTIRQSINTEASARTEGDASLRLLIQQVNAAFVNYYLKTETYSKTEVNNLINNEAETRQQAISAEASRATGVENALQTAIDIINGKIPAQATTSNQLADKDFVNSSISTATAEFKGTYNSLQELEQVTANANDYAFVIATDAAGNTVYKRYKWVEGTGWRWEYDLNNSSFTAEQWAAIQSGITAALVTKLSDLPTNAELNQRISTAITTALGQYYTKTEIDSALQSINTAIGQKANQSDLTDEVNRATQAEQANAQNITTLQDLVAFINKSFGKYDGQTVKTLSQAKAGKYVNVNGGETSASGYGISEPITLNAGDILLVPSAQAVPATVSVVARLVDRTYQKVIVYTYTYQQANPELYATATADYDPSLVYTAIYDTTGETPVLTGWALGSVVYQTLPATHEVSEQFYEPLMKQAVAAMPSTGYYIYLCPTPMTIVVSGYTATVSGGEALVVGWGIFKNITTNFVGAPGQSVLAQAFAVLFAAIDGLTAQLANLGETKAKSIDFEESPKLCGQDMYIQGNGAPTAPVVPTMIGQEYMDLTNRKLYKAFAITNNVSDWVLIN